MVEGLTDDALAWLQGRRWPGNVRQLSNLLEWVVVLEEGSWVSARALIEVAVQDKAPAVEALSLDAAVASGEPLDAIQREYTRRVVQACGGNRSEAARRLGIDRRTVQRWLEEGG